MLLLLCYAQTLGPPLPRTPRISSPFFAIRYFTSCLPVLSLVYVISLSFSIVYLCALMVLISVRLLPSLFACPMSSCLLLKSPVIIVFQFLCCFCV